MATCTGMWGNCCIERTPPAPPQTLSQNCSFQTVCFWRNLSIKKPFESKMLNMIEEKRFQRIINHHLSTTWLTLRCYWEYMKMCFKNRHPLNLCNVTTAQHNHAIPWSNLSNATSYTWCAQACILPLSPQKNINERFELNNIYYTCISATLHLIDTWPHVRGINSPWKCYYPCTVASPSFPCQ